MSFSFQESSQSTAKTVVKRNSFSGLDSLKSLFFGHRTTQKNAGKPEPTKRSFRSRLKISFSTSSLPAQAQAASSSSPSVPPGEKADERAGLSSSHSTVSLPARIVPPFASHSPSLSSTSSTSSLECTSDASTAVTTPSGSSPSILIKSNSSSSVSTLNSPSSNPLPKEASPIRGPSGSPKKTTECYRKHPSPLSTVTDAQCSHYILPHLPRSQTTANFEKPKSLNPMRRRSLGILLRRTQSHDDLTDLSGLPPLPNVPTSGPRTGSTLSTPVRSKTIRKKLNDPVNSSDTAYTAEEKLERISILGADPAGMGYYLYPPTPKELAKKEIAKRRNSTGPTFGMRSAGTGPNREDLKAKARIHPDTGSNRGGPAGSRNLRDARGRNFRKTVTAQVIMEESGDSEPRPEQQVSSKESVSGGSEKCPILPSMPSQQLGLHSDAGGTTPKPDISSPGPLPETTKAGKQL